MHTGSALLLRARAGQPPPRACAPVCARCADAAACKAGKRTSKQRTRRVGAARRKRRQQAYSHGDERHAPDFHPAQFMRVMTLWPAPGPPLITTRARCPRTRRRTPAGCTSLHLQHRVWQVCCPPRASRPVPVRGRAAALASSRVAAERPDAAQKPATPPGRGLATARPQWRDAASRAPLGAPPPSPALPRPGAPLQRCRPAQRAAHAGWPRDSTKSARAHRSHDRRTLTRAIRTLHPHPHHHPNTSPAPCSPACAPSRHRPVAPHRRGNCFFFPRQLFLTCRRGSQTFVTPCRKMA